MDRSPAPNSRFTSRNERRLWLGAGLAVLAIYASVPWAGALATWLGSDVLLGVLFAGFLLLAVVAVVGTGLARDAGPRTAWIGLGVAVCYGMLVVRMGVTPLERSHIFEYGVVAVLIHQALRERSKNGKRVRVPWLLAILATAAVGWIDEGLQAVVPGRVYDLRDVGTNALAGLVAVAAASALGWARRRDVLGRNG